MQSNHSQIRSAVVIARLLDAEGFTDHVANRIESYWKSHSGLTDRQRQKLERIDSELSDFMRDKTEKEKLLVGRFIGIHKKMSFDTGLRIGLTAFATQNDKTVET